MAIVRPFIAYRPTPEMASEVAAKPYDVLNSDEARQEVKGHRYSFLHVGKPEVDLDPSIDIHDPCVYGKAKENLQALIRDGLLVPDPAPSLYVYAQTMNGRTQYGIVGCASIEEYLDTTIRKHELTRADKEEDRRNHVRVTNAQTGPVFLTYRDDLQINAIVSKIVVTPPVNDHVASDGVRHQTWVISDPAVIDAIRGRFRTVPNLYVADGHHRSAAAAAVGLERKKANPGHCGNEEYNFFLAVIFPASQLLIMDYNRVVKDLNGLACDELSSRCRNNFSIRPSAVSVSPLMKGDFGVYCDHQWNILSASPEILSNPDPVQRLDVSILQNFVLGPVLGIHDPRIDKRIDFVGGIRGLGELTRRVDSGEMAIAFSLHPTSISELMTIADAGKIMPPKSTWFEPKLRDGLFVHFLD